MLGKNNPSTRCHNLEALNPQHQNCWNLKSHNKSSVWLKTLYTVQSHFHREHCAWCHCKPHDFYILCKKVTESRNRPGVAQRVPEGLGSQISTTFNTWRWWGCQPHAPAAFTSRKCSWYSFSLGAELTPGPCYTKEYVTEKSGDTAGNRSWNRPTSSVAP
jgi:hypothetical protein